jgi:glycosyltransferase involved in cell wall biosynthesis
MKILLVASEYLPHGSGIANVAYSLKVHLQKKDAKVDVLSCGEADISVNDVSNVFPGLAGLIPFWQEAANYIEKKADEYDVIWLHSPLLIGTRKLRHANKIMVTIHSTYYGFYQAYKAHAVCHLLPYYYLATKLEHHFFNELSHNNKVIVTATSPSVAKEARRNGLSLFPYVVTHGLETKHHALDKYRSRMLLQEKYSMRLSENDRILLYIGRITEVKQPLLLVELFKAISFFKPDTHLMIVGSGNLFTKLRKKTSLIRNLHLLGHIPHESLSTFLGAADAFISLSCYEGGLPLSVLEAASFGLPLILSDIPTHRLIINSRIGYGMLLDSRNPSLKKIIKFIEDGIGVTKEGNELRTRHYTWDNVANQYLTLLHDF